MFADLKPIQRGSEGDVFMMVAKIKKNACDAKREYMLQRVCASPCVVPVEYVEIGRMIMMPAAEMDLLTFLVAKKGQLPSVEAWRIVRQMSSALFTIHGRRIVHRDVKLENFLCFKSGDVKLSDFGFATKLARGDKLSARIGTPTYVAPEILAGEEYDEKVDVWSFGVCVFTLLTSCKPFDTQDYGTLDPVALRRWRAIVGSLSESQRAVVVRTLRADPENRASSKDIFKLRMLCAGSRGVKLEPEH